MRRIASAILLALAVLLSSLFNEAAYACPSGSKVPGCESSRAKVTTKGGTGKVSGYFDVFGRKARDPGSTGPNRKMSTLLGQLMFGLVEFVSSGGLLIQAATGRACGTGWWRTNRSGWAA